MTHLFLLLPFLSSCLSTQKHFLAKSKQGKYFLLETEETEEAKPKLGTHKHFLAKSKQGIGKHFLLETETNEAKSKQGTHTHGARVAKIVGSCDPGSRVA